MSSTPTSQTSTKSQTPSTNIPTANSTLQLLQNANHYITLKFSPHNYLYWRTQMWPFLVGQGLSGFGDGTKACPQPPI